MGVLSLALLLGGGAGAPWTEVARAQQAPDGVPAARYAGMFKAPHVPGELLVKYRDGAGKRAADAIRQAGLEIAEVHPSQPTLLRVTAASDEHALEAAGELAERPDVELVEPNYLYTTLATPNDPRFGDQWGLRSSNGVDIAAVAAWDKTVGSEEVVVGVIDSGMDVKHQDLKENLFVNTGEVPNNGVDDDLNGYVDDVSGWDGVTNSGRMKDEDGHGTHVSGIVGARGNNGIGVTGVAWRVKLVPLRFITVRSGSTFDAIECIDYAVKLRIGGVNLRAINNSWGGGGYSQALANAIQRANNAGILFVCAAGNESVDNDAQPHYPSNYEIPNVVSVGAMTKANTIAGFSNYGRRSVDIFAPGDTIVSTRPNNEYGAGSGTSQASPFVTGIAALILAMRPDATVAELKARLLGSSISEQYAGPRSLTGGRASASNALRAETTAPAALVDFRIRSVSRSTVALEWTAVGDDGTSGQATYYDIRWSASPITDANFDLASQINDTRVPLRAGEVESALVRGCFSADGAVFVAMRVYDKAANFAQSSTLIAEPTGELQSYRMLPVGADDGDRGAPLGLRADDKTASVDLPFEFPFFGAGYRTAYVSTNGLITFDAPNAAPVGSRTDLGTLTAIAALWTDIRTDGKLAANEDVFMKTSPSSVTFRWVAELYYAPGEQPKDAQPVTFAVTLHEDGAIDFVYGPGGNRALRAGSSLPVVGVSDGGCSLRTLEGYSGSASLANVPAIRLEPTDSAQTGGPALSNTPIPAGLTEGLPVEFVVRAEDGSGAPVAVAAALPRNATFNPASGQVLFVPDSSQDGDVLFAFSATNAAGATTTRVVSVRVLEDPNIPEVKFVKNSKKKVVFNGIGFRVGARILIDGTEAGDVKYNKKAPSKKLASANAKSMISGDGPHVIVVENPDGVTSGPYFLW